MRQKESIYGTKRLNECLPVVCSFWGVTPSQVLGNSRLRNIVNARHSLRYFLTMQNDLPLAEIATLTNGDHSTVAHSRKIFLIYVEGDSKFKQMLRIMKGDYTHYQKISFETRLKEIIISGLKIQDKVKLIKELNEN